MMALSAGGRCWATCRLLKPLHEMPVMPTLPLHQSRSASQAMASQMSSCSRTEYSSASVPSESPLPRRSRRTQAKPWPAT